jgi:hypothetical protein
MTAKYLSNQKDSTLCWECCLFGLIRNFLLTVESSFLVMLMVKFYYSWLLLSSPSRPSFTPCGKAIIKTFLKNATEVKFSKFHFNDMQYVIYCILYIGILRRHSCWCIQIHHKKLNVLLYVKKHT